MRLPLCFALLFAFAAQAEVAPRLAWELLLGQSSDDDEEEEETPAKPAEKPKTPSQAPAAEPGPKPTQPPTAAAAGAGALAAPSGEQQKLVSGAPLYNPNVAVHIVEKKGFADRGKKELILYPVAIQANGKATQHIGTAFSAVHHAHENFGFQLSGVYNWFTSESAFNGEMLDKIHREFQTATSLLLVWGVQGGVEVTPLYGKFAWYQESLAHFSVVVNGGAGVGSTRHLINPGKSGPATFGDTGLKFLGSLGAGFRLQFGQQFALRLELRDLVYTARVDAVNGCDFEDLNAMKGNLEKANVRPGCKKEKFKDTLDVNLAKNLVETPSSDVLNNLGVYAGAAFLF